MADRIRSAIEGVIRFYSKHPDKGRMSDTAAVAVLEEGLRCKAEGPNGAVLVSDMPKVVGGGDAAPTPGWFMRAALATCDATVIAMRAAQLGVTLRKLEVKVDSVLDHRGMFGVADDVPAGPASMHVRVLIASDAASAEQLRQIVEWADSHSPVGDALRRTVPSVMEVDVA